MIKYILKRQIKINEADVKFVSELYPNLKEKIKAIPTFQEKEIEKISKLYDVVVRIWYILGQDLFRGFNWIWVDAKLWDKIDEDGK